MSKNNDAQLMTMILIILLILTMCNHLGYICISDNKNKPST